MNEFTRKAASLAEAYANQVAAFIACKPHNMDAARSTLLSHLEGAEQVSRRAALEDAISVVNELALAGHISDKGITCEAMDAIRVLADEGMKL